MKMLGVKIYYLFLTKKLVSFFKILTNLLIAYLMKKKYLLFFSLFCVLALHAQTRIKFGYDVAGNQTKRYICINCTAKVAVQDSIPVSKDFKQASADDLSKDEINQNSPQLSYYPNPVREELHIQWSTEGTNDVSKIELYTISGQSLKEFSDFKNRNSETIPFSQYPEGYYSVILIYSNGDRKSLNIIKK